MSFEWTPVECKHRNGEITSYQISQEKESDTTTTTHTVAATDGGDGGVFTISGLEPSVIYSVEIAAVNGAGTGINTASFTALTDGGFQLCIH